MVARHRRQQSMNLSGESDLTDEKFKSLVEKLIDLEEKAEFLNEPWSPIYPAPLGNKWELKKDAPSPSPILPLSEDLKKMRNDEESRLIVRPKFRGLPVYLEYVDGVLGYAQMFTNEKSYDITDSAYNINCISKTLLLMNEWRTCEYIPEENSIPHKIIVEGTLFINDVNMAPLVDKIANEAYISEVIKKITQYDCAPYVKGEVLKPFEQIYPDIFSLAADRIRFEDEDGKEIVVNSLEDKMNWALGIGISVYQFYHVTVIEEDDELPDVVRSWKEFAIDSVMPIDGVIVQADTQKAVQKLAEINKPAHFIIPFNE